MEKLSDFHIGQRVKMHPATDLWMRGDRYGTVTDVGRKYVHVRMDRSGRIVYILPNDILEVGE